MVSSKIASGAEAKEGMEGDLESLVIDSLPSKSRFRSKPEDKYNVNGRCIEKDVEYEITGISDIIDSSLWKVLDKATQAKIKAYALQQRRPEGIDADLWSTLNDDDKLLIANADLNRDRGRSDEPESDEMDIPDEISYTTWERLHKNTRTSIIDKLYLIRPSGFDVALWDCMGDTTKKDITRDLNDFKLSSRSKKEAEFKRDSWGILSTRAHEFITREAPYPPKTYARWWMQRFTIHSRVLTFFYSGVHIIEDPDAGISAMVLVCALILTIPFGVFSFVNDSWFTALKNNLALCPDQSSYSGQDFGIIQDRVTKSISACMYSSMMGLILSSLYFVFKPLGGKEIDRWCRTQGRVLIASLFTVTAFAVAGVMALGLYLLEFGAVLGNDICVYNVNPVYVPGIIGLTVSFIVGLSCMW